MDQCVGSIFGTQFHLLLISVFGRIAGSASALTGGSEHGNQVNLEMHLQIGIEPVKRYTWRLISSEVQDALRGHSEAQWSSQLEATVIRT